MGRARGRKRQGATSRSVRIIAGQWRGRILQVPSAQTTRPTTDRVKEAMMSALFSARGGFDGAWVLDAFAGGGSLGLEALSRGAARVRFCESDATALRILRSNIAQLPGAGKLTEVCRGDAFAVACLPSDRPFDLVLLDPPYATPASQVCALIVRLDGCGLLTDNALVCYEHAGTDDSTVRTELERIQWTLQKNKRYGDIAFALARKDAE
ncbi:MAG: 16S rRNA (guanine(966)-N(2))-methyltransferase RsmD [Eggerthellaceae bacterium]|jgi:16S rRNA (guanine966-N2)-methyltransferase